MFEGRRIVLVEDDEIMGASLMQRLSLEGADVQWHRQIARALPAIRTPRKRLDAVICDIHMPDGTGESLFKTLTRTGRPPPFLFITGQGEIDQAVRLIRSGAADYITKPFDIGSFLLRLSLVMRPKDDEAVSPECGITDLARALDRQMLEAAARDTPLLIRGGAGLGKIRMARRIHDLSDRRAAPLTIIDTLRDQHDRPDLLSAIGKAGDGTLLIIDIGRLGADAQITLVDEVRSRMFRLMATAGQNFDMKEGAACLRADLSALLNSHEIYVPPLADRPEDAVWLAAQLFAILNPRRATPLAGISASAEEAIRAHDWPGNGRELRARVLRAVETAREDLVLPSDLFPERGTLDAIRPLSEARDVAERAQIAAALDHTHGHIGEAARLLRVSRTTLWEKMQKFGL